MYGGSFAPTSNARRYAHGTTVPPRDASGWQAGQRLSMPRSSRWRTPKPFLPVTISGSALDSRGGRRGGSPSRSRRAQRSPRRGFPRRSITPRRGFRMCLWPPGAATARGCRGGAGRPQVGRRARLAQLHGNFGEPPPESRPCPVPEVGLGGVLHALTAVRVASCSRPRCPRGWRRARREIDRRSRSALAKLLSAQAASARPKRRRSLLRGRRRTNAPRRQRWCAISPLGVRLLAQYGLGPLASICAARPHPDEPPRLATRVLLLLPVAAWSSGRADRVRRLRRYMPCAPGHRRQLAEPTRAETRGTPTPWLCPSPRASAGNAKDQLRFAIFGAARAAESRDASGNRHVQRRLCRGSSRLQFPVPLITLCHAFAAASGGSVCWVHLLLAPPGRAGPGNGRSAHGTADLGCARARLPAISSGFLVLAA